MLTADAGSAAMSGRGSAMAAGALYLALALWAMRVVLPAPGSLLSYPVHLEGNAFLRIYQLDQRLVVWTIARNARALLASPTHIFNSEQCHPIRNALAFGEHMLGDGLLGLVPYWLTGEPILTCNVVLLFTQWLPAIAMYALIRQWTGSGEAALVAGFLFAFHPLRIGDPAHPFVHGNHWIPLALLFAQRLFVRGRWLDALGLTAFVALSLLESVYQDFVLLLIGVPFGLSLLVRHLRRLPRLAPQLLVFAATVGAVAAAVFGPYLRVAAAWGTLAGHFSPPLRPWQLWHGRVNYPGTVACVLAGLGLLDRLRGVRGAGDGDHRLVMAAGGLVVAWFVVYPIVLPGLGPIPSLGALLTEVLPEIGVRGSNNVVLGIHLVVAVLAGYGLLAVIERRGALGRRVLTILVLLAAVLEQLHPRLATASFGRANALRAWPGRPPDEVVEMVKRAGPGPVLDLPFVGLGAADYLLLAAFHHQPVAACADSFLPSTLPDVQALAARLPAAAAADALYALGFRTVVIHAHEPARLLPALERFAQAGARDARLALVGATETEAVFSLRSPEPVVAGFEAIAPPDGRGQDAGLVEPLRVAPPEANVDLPFRNHAEATYRHPDPIEPTVVVVRWNSRGGPPAAQYETRLLLPLALAREEEGWRTLKVPVPAATGEYLVTVAPRERPELVIAARTVRVEPAPENPEKAEGR